MHNLQITHPITLIIIYIWKMRLAQQIASCMIFKSMKLHESEMTFSNLVRFGAALPAIGGICVLYGCAGPMPAANPNKAWVGLQEEPTTTLMAEAVDGKQLDDGRYFQVSAGEHTLLTRLFVEGGGTVTAGHVTSA